MLKKKFLNEGDQIHNFISSSGSDFLTSYGSGSGSTRQKVTVPVPVPQHCLPEDAHHAGHRLPAGQEVLPRVEHHRRVGGGLGRRLAHDPLEDAFEDVEEVGEVGSRGLDGQLGDSFHGSGPNRPE